MIRKKCTWCLKNHSEWLTTGQKATMGQLEWTRLQKKKWSRKATFKFLQLSWYLSQKSLRGIVWQPLWLIQCFTSIQIQEDQQTIHHHRDGHRHHLVDQLQGWLGGLQASTLGPHLHAKGEVFQAHIDIGQVGFIHNQGLNGTIFWNWGTALRSLETPFEEATSSKYDIHLQIRKKENKLWWYPQQQ